MRAEYADLLERLPGVVAAAPLIFCGMAACVDACVVMHDMDRLLAERHVPEAMRLADLLRDRAARGVGGEFWFDWLEGPRWLAEHVPVRHGLGETGPQAAWVLSVLGARALVALADRSAHMLARLNGRILLAEADALVPASEVQARGEPRPDIFIFEFTRGVAVGGVMPPRSSRVIVRFANHGLEHDDAFDRLSVGLAGSAGAGLLSGFSNVPADALAAELARVAALAAGWRAGGLGVVHLEWSGYDTPAIGAQVLDGMRRAMTSLGMSHSEYRVMSPSPDLATGLCALGDRLGIDRVCVHADGWAAAATLGDADAERQALMTGCLLAGARAAAGKPVRPGSIDASARFSAPPFPRPVRSGRWNLVSCSSPFLAAPVTTLGLGDTFAAGCLLALAATRSL